MRKFEADERLRLEQMKTVRQEPPLAGRPLTLNRVDVREPGCVSLASPNGKIVLSPFDRGIFRICLLDRRDRRAWALNNSWTIDLPAGNSRGWRLDDSGTILRFRSELRDGSEGSVEVDPARGIVSCRVGQDLAVSDTVAPQLARRWVLVKKRVGAAGPVRVFGLGENTRPMDKAGHRVVMWNMPPWIYRTGANPLYQSWPVAIFLRQDGTATGLVFDSPAYSVFDFSPDGKTVSYAVKDTCLSYFVLMGPRLPDVVRQLGSLTGTLPPIPKWVLGYHQSRWSYAPSSRVREVAGEFRKRDIPCDAIYLDIDYMDDFKCFTWGPGFADHDGLVKDLHEQGFKVVTILDPGIKVESGYGAYESGLQSGAFITARNGRAVTGKVWAGKSHFPDFASAPVRKWWGGLVRNFVAAGVDGIWCDMDEPTTFDGNFSLPPRAVQRPPAIATVRHERIHNVYGYLMSRATYEGLSDSGKLPFVMTRSTYLGGQKYATTWTGDNWSDWDHLRASVPMILSLGLSGQPVVGPDIGGYNGTPSPELYERWILQGALYPYSRTHTRKNTGNQEPWSFGPRVESSARRAIRLRYRLIPYFYSLAYESSRTGEPIARPIFYYQAEPGTLDPQFYESEFLLGPHLLVAPLMDEKPARKFYLPRGGWRSWWSFRAIEGGRVHETSPEEDTDLPLFIRDNAVVPLYPERMAYVPESSPQALELLATVRDEAEGTVVEHFDMGSLLAYRVRFTREDGGIHGNIEAIRHGRVPAGYVPPETLRIRIDRQVTGLDVESRCSGHSLEAGQAWTRATITNPEFPLGCTFRL